MAVAAVRNANSDTHNYTHTHSVNVVSCIAAMMHRHSKQQCLVAVLVVIGGSNVDSGWLRHLMALMHHQGAWWVVVIIRCDAHTHTHTHKVAVVVATTIVTYR